MGILDILKGYASREPTDQRFANFAEHAPHEVIADGLAYAFRSDETRPIGYMVQALYRYSSEEEKAGLLNTIVGTLGAGSAGSLAGGVLATVCSEQSSYIAPERASRISPQAISDVVAEASLIRPNIAEELARYYAGRPSLMGHLSSDERTTILSSVVGKWPPP